MQSPSHSERGGKRDRGEDSSGNDRGAQQAQQQYYLRGGNESDKTGSAHGRDAAGTPSREKVLISADKKQSNEPVAFQLQKRVRTPTVRRADDYDDAAADERHLGNTRGRQLLEGKNDTNAAGMGYSQWSHFLLKPTRRQV